MLTLIASLFLDPSLHEGRELSFSCHILEGKSMNHAQKRMQTTVDAAISEREIHMPSIR